MAYLLDTNVFITARNRHYGRDFCPGFWDWLVAAHSAGIVQSVERVATELRNTDDELKTLANQWGRAFFASPNQEDLWAMKRVMDWVRSQDWELSGVDRFSREADSYLISHALTGGHAVVTHEVPSNSKKKIKIPNVCKGLGVKCMDPFDMLRMENVRLVLDPVVKRALGRGQGGRVTARRPQDLFSRRQAQ